MADVERINPETGEIVTVNNNGQVPDIADDTMDLLEKYSGAGYSALSEDGLTPVLSILQDNSGEVKRNHERRIENAESGMMIIRSLRQLYKGDKGITVQPFGFDHFWVEWTGEVGEGIPVGRFPFHEPPTDMFEVQDQQNPNKKINKRRSTGNRMVDTREHYVNLINGVDRPYPVVVPMSGSNHSASRLWTNMMRNMVYKGRQLPAFFRLYNLRTIFRKRGANQTWYGFQVDPAAMVRDRELLQLGADNFDALKVKPIEGNLADMAGGTDEETQTAHHPGVDPNTVI